MFSGWLKVFLNRLNDMQCIIDAINCGFGDALCYEGPMWESVIEDKLNSSSLKQSLLNFTAAFMTSRVIITVNFDVAACNLIVCGHISSGRVWLVCDPSRQTFEEAPTDWFCSSNQLK